MTVQSAQHTAQSEQHSAPSGGDRANRTRTDAGFDTVEFAVAEIAAGHAVVVIDDEDRENEGDLIFAAELVTPELIAFMVRYTS